LNEGDRIPETLAKITLETGPLHGLVHCAGIAPIRPLRVETLAQVNNVLQMNVSTAILLARGFRQKGCREREASIVLVSSVMGLLGEKARAAYCASKGAIVSLTKALALELASEEIRVNCVAPALVRTEMHEALSESLTESQKVELSAAAPLGLGRPRDVSYAMAFLLSDASRWITGTTLVVDGGYSAQ
jgi:NAD(P)-dependent dehydrogenase (short-subunit alcohol dehydrogenase family)